MKSKAKNKKRASIIAASVGTLVILAGGGYYLAVQDNDNSGEPALSEQEKEIQENLASKEEQLEENTSNTTPSNTNQTNPSTTPAQSLTTLSDANITATKAGDTVYLSAYGIGQGTYEVEKNGTKLTLTDPSYIGTGGLAITSIAVSEKSAKYQIFLITNGQRTAASKIITVTTTFDGTKTFVGQ